MKVFRDNAPLYWAVGIPAMPLKIKSKAPILSEWTAYGTTMPSSAVRDHWMETYPRSNIGLPFGPASGLCAIDIDTVDESIVEAIMDCLPASPWKRIGKKGCALIFKWQGQKNFKIRDDSGMLCEFLGLGNQLVLPPSIHPDTNEPYVADANLWEVMDKIQPLGVDIEDRLRKAFGDRGHTLNKKRSSSTAAQAKVPQQQLSVGQDGVERYLAQELSEALSDISATTEGARNDTLFKTAARMARHVSGARAAWETYASALAASARAAGLGEPEIVATLESAWNAGSAEPTPWVRVVREQVYLASQERFYHLKSGKDLKPTGFNGLFGSLYTGKGTFSNFLLSNGFVRKVHDLTYDPLDAQQFIWRDETEWLNTYKPSNVVPVAGDAIPFIDFLAGLVPDGVEREHLLRMIAFTVRHPGKKLRHALLLRTSVQGVGKSMLLDIWASLLGRHNVRKTTSKELSGEYQGYLPERLLIICEELNLGMGFKTYNDLKDMITADRVLVNEKHLRQREWDVYATFAFLTNLPLPIFVEETDRRFFYIDSPAQKRESNYYKVFADWWPANLGVIRHHLDGIDLSSFSTHDAPPVTASKLGLIEGSRSELAQDLALAIRERRGCFDRDVVTLDQVRVELGWVARTKTETQLTKALKEVGAKPLGQQRVPGAGRASTWAIRNVGYWAPASAVVRGQELQRASGVFAMLDGTGIEVVHISEWPGDFPAIPEAA